ncbi:serine/arginine repetitive matrix protein 1-like [Macrosteles quadrilineatus]|uniref:serine/arginine repetitive matrix protein 1-like n=1 Tax=Macrosteles quadrilineatus TaxID=74068 RepID=UPI0023E2F285|nr:serine/arginine repetitive matrix protein 1-like [Macrosteles quadrilineatus]
MSSDPRPPTPDRDNLEPEDMELDREIEEFLGANWAWIARLLDCSDLEVGEIRSRSPSPAAMHLPLEEQPPSPAVEPQQVGGHLPASPPCRRVRFASPCQQPCLVSPPRQRPRPVSLANQRPCPVSPSRQRPYPAAPPRHRLRPASPPHRRRGPAAAPRHRLRHASPPCRRPSPAAPPRSRPVLRPRRLPERPRRASPPCRPRWEEAPEGAASNPARRRPTPIIWELALPRSPARFPVRRTETDEIVAGNDLPLSRAVLLRLAATYNQLTPEQRRNKRWRIMLGADRYVRLRPSQVLRVVRGRLPELRRRFQPR